MAVVHQALWVPHTHVGNKDNIMQEFLKALVAVQAQSTNVAKAMGAEAWTSLVTTHAAQAMPKRGVWNGSDGTIYVFEVESSTVWNWWSLNARTSEVARVIRRDGELDTRPAAPNRRAYASGHVFVCEMSIINDIDRQLGTTFMVSCLKALTPAN